MPPPSCGDNVSHVAPRNAPISYHDAAPATALGTSNSKETSGFFAQPGAMAMVRTESRRAARPIISLVHRLTHRLHLVGGDDDGNHLRDRPRNQLQAVRADRNGACVDR